MTGFRRARGAAAPQRRPAGGRRRAAGALAALGALAIATPALAAPMVAFDLTGPRLLGLVALAVVFIGGLVLMRPRMPDVLRAIFVWGGFAVVLVTLYAFRADLEMIGRETLAALVPGLAVERDGGSVVVNRVSGGHFRLKGEVNGQPVSFLFDTGASSVVLTHGDAAAAGIDPRELSYALPVMTANGVTRVASVTLDSVSVGPIEIRDVRAAVAQPNQLQVSLLGNTFLNRISGYQVSQNRLVLNP